MSKEFNSQWYDEYQNRSAPPRAEPQPIVCDEPLAEIPRKAEMSPGVIVRIKSFRRKLVDPDNLTGGCKYFIDGLRHAGLISDDRPEDITLEVRQEKVKTKAEERTEIEVGPI